MAKVRRRLTSFSYDMGAMAMDRKWPKGKEEVKACHTPSNPCDVKSYGIGLLNGQHYR